MRAFEILHILANVLMLILWWVIVTNTEYKGASIILLVITAPVIIRSYLLFFGRDYGSQESFYR